jgi:hypothetical protein
MSSSISSSNLRHLPSSSLLLLSWLIAPFGAESDHCSAKSAAMQAVNPIDRCRGADSAVLLYCSYLLYRCKKERRKEERGKWKWSCFWRKGTELGRRVEWKKERRSGCFQQTSFLPLLSSGRERERKRPATILSSFSLVGWDGWGLVELAGRQGRAEAAAVGLFCPTRARCFVNNYLHVTFHSSVLPREEAVG